MGRNSAVVFGSAVQGATTPGDIDVAYTGSRNAAAQAALAWARRRGLGHLPLDLHRATETISLPAPCGEPGPYEVLIGSDLVSWRPVWTLAAHVRAYGTDPGTLNAALAAQGWFRLALLPGDGDDPADPDWGWYVEGLPALVSAVAKNPQARTVLTGRWPLLGQLLDADPRPAPATLKWLRDGSGTASAGAVIAILVPDDPELRLEYGGTALTVEDLLP